MNRILEPSVELATNPSLSCVGNPQSEVACGVSVAGAKSRAAGNRLGEIDDVAPLVAFLYGPETRWITAQTLRVNRGMA
jgi:NAD(P)-dependent dehydrogenase (short-subunit alcohol dehydrogenase family)